MAGGHHGGAEFCETDDEDTTEDYAAALATARELGVCVCVRACVRACVCKYARSTDC